MATEENNNSVEFQEIYDQLPDLPLAESIQVMALNSVTKEFGTKIIQDAMPTANAAFDKATQAISTAATANTKAESVDLKTEQLAQTVSGYSGAISNANQNANNANAKADQLGQTVNGYTGAINSANTKGDNAVSTANSALSAASDALNETAGSLKKGSIATTVTALKFDKAITVMPVFTTSGPVVYTIDPTDVTELGSVSLSIIQNHEVTFPGFVELEGSKDDKIDGSRVEYLLFVKSGIYYFARTYAKVEPVVIGDSDLNIGTITANSIQLNWQQGANATAAIIERYLNADHSDQPVQVYSGSDLTFTDTGLNPNTAYYYKKRNTDGINFSNAAYATAKTAVLDSDDYIPSNTILANYIFNTQSDIDSFLANYGGNGNVIGTLVTENGVKKAHFVGSSADNGDYFNFAGVVQDFDVNYNARFTITKVSFVNAIPALIPQFPTSSNQSFNLITDLNTINYAQGAFNSPSDYSRIYPRQGVSIRQICIERTN